MICIAPHLSPPLASSVTQPWSRDRMCPSLPCWSPAACSVGAWHGATGPEQEGRKRVSPSGCQLSQLTQLDTSLPPPPGTQPPISPVFRLVWWFSGGSTPPPTARGAWSAAWGCQQRHLGPLPAGLVGPLSGRFKPAAMESSEYGSRCFRQGPGEDHLTGRWVTQREGKGCGLESAGPQGLEEEGKLSPSGCLPGEEEEGDRRKDKMTAGDLTRVESKSSPEQAVALMELKPLPGQTATVAIKT